MQKGYGEGINNMQQGDWGAGRGRVEGDGERGREGERGRKRGCRMGLVQALKISKPTSSDILSTVRPQFLILPLIGHQAFIFKTLFPFKLPQVSTKPRYSHLFKCILNFRIDRTIQMFPFLVLPRKQKMGANTDYERGPIPNTFEPSIVCPDTVMYFLISRRRYLSHDALVHQRLRYLNTWYPVDGAVWGGFGCRF